MYRSDPDHLPPFQVIHRRTNATNNGDFIPAAEVAFGPPSSVAELIGHISVSDLRLVIAVLTLVTPGGRIFATATRVGRVIRRPTLTSYFSLVRLCHIKYRGTPLLVKLTHEGITTYSPSVELLGERMGPLELDDPPNTQMIIASKEQVIEVARRQYAVPREQAEVEIATAHGWPMPAEEEIRAAYEALPDPELTGADARVRNRLTRLGVERHTADSLVRTYGRDRCIRQLAYLPYRKSGKAKSKAGLLIASIVNDYAAPPLPHGPEGT